MNFQNEMEMNYMDIVPILTKLKNGLLQANPKLEYSDFGSDKKRERNYKDFYLLDYENNCFDKPVKVKLGSGTRAVKSSAAFIYNIFGEDPIVFEEKNYKKMQFEKGLDALLNRPKAQLDGYLISEDETKEIFFETKLLEWSGSPKNLAIAYLDEKNYPIENKHSKEFISFFKSIVDENKSSESKGVVRVAHKTKVYDAIQMTIHILGIYNALCNKKLKTKNIELINLVWDYDHPRYKKEATEAKDLIQKMEKDFIPFFDELDISFQVRYISFSDLITKIKFTNNLRLDYLKKRYLLK